MIEILSYRSSIKGARQGNLSLRIPAWKLEIRDMTLFMKNGHRWLSMPSRSYEKDGETKYSPFLYFFDKDQNDKFQKVALDALDKWIKENPPKQEVPNLPEMELSFGSGNSNHGGDDVPF